jgi:uncharacterized Zn-binding protein involved in type VI secretion
MRAARFDDPIGHTYALEGLITGSALGAVAGVVAGAAVVVGVGIFAALTAPLSVPALLGAAALTTTGVLSMAGGGLLGAAAGAGFGEFVGSLSAVSGLTSRGFTGKIAGGSPDVFINSKKAARIGIDEVPCYKDPKVVALIAMGSRNVFINDYHAARMDDKVSCGAKIKEGSEDVYIGGEQEKFMEVDEEVSGGVRGLVLGTAAAGAMILGGAVALPVLGAALGAVGALLVGEAAGLLVFGVSLGVGAKADPVFRSVGRNVGEILHNVFGFNVLPSEFEDGASLLGGTLLGWLGVKGARIVGRSRIDRNTFFSIVGGPPLRRGRKHGDPDGTSQEIAELFKEAEWPANWRGRPDPDSPPPRRAVGNEAERHAHEVGVTQGRRYATEILGYEETSWVNPRENRGSFGQGIDDVLKDPRTGNDVIVEYKGGKSDLEPGQMERPWVQEKINEIREDGNTPLADRLQKQLDAGTLRGIAIKTPLGENGATGQTYILREFSY